MARRGGRKGWAARRFDTPIAVDKAELRTLQDAIRWLAEGLPTARHKDADVQLAARLVIEAAEKGGILMMADIAVRQVAKGQSSGGS